MAKHFMELIMKNLKLKSFPVLIVLLFRFSIANAESTRIQKYLSDVRNKEIGIAKVTFIKGLTLDDVIPLLSSLKANIAIIESSFQIGSHTQHEFYSLPPNKSDAIDVDILKDEYANNRMLMLNTLLETSNDLESDFPFKQRVLLSEISKYQDNLNSILIDSITLIASKDVFANNLMSKKTLSLEFYSLDKIKEINAYKINSYNSNRLSSQALAPWEPEQGISYVGQYSNGTRYSLQYMKWNTNNFAPNATYEHDFFLNNYNNNAGTYLDRRSTPFFGCFPFNIYAVSSWPSTAHPYLDTRLAQNFLGCEYQEVPYTIGAAKADAIPVGVWQYTYFHTQPGDVNFDKFKLQAQKGFRVPSSCYSVWCSFSDDIVNLVPAWNSSVPGVVSW